MTKIILLLMELILDIAIVIALLMSMVAVFTYLERKVIAFIQNRIGPNRVGFKGVFQPLADIIKLFFKETIIPAKANKVLFIIAPIFSLVISLTVWSVIPFDRRLVIADLNIGILYILAMTSFNIYGIIFAGWASNSRYAFLGALRATAQIISYEIAMGFSIISVLMLSSSMNLTKIVLSQRGGITTWYWLPLFPFLIIYFISAIIETNRAPFDVTEGDTELVAGIHVEYSGIMFAMFFMAEYANMILVSLLTVIMFFGGWLSPFEGVYVIQQYLYWVPVIFWLFIKTIFFMFTFLWFRATFPRYRYDQIMSLGWKFFIPITTILLFIESIVIKIGILE